MQAKQNVTKFCTRGLGKPSGLRVENARFLSLVTSTFQKGLLCTAPLLTAPLLTVARGADLRAAASGARQRACPADPLSRRRSSRTTASRRRAAAGPACVLVLVLVPPPPIPNGWHSTLRPPRTPYVQERAITRGVGLCCSAPQCASACPCHTPRQPNGRSGAWGRGKRFGEASTLFSRP